MTSCHSKPLDNDERMLELTVSSNQSKFLALRNRRQAKFESSDGILEQTLFREDVDSVTFERKISKKISESVLQTPQDDFNGLAADSLIPSKLNLITATEQTFLAPFSDVRKAKVVPAATGLLTSDILVNSQIVIPVAFTKFHTQDESGRASFGHVTADQSATNFRDAHGNQIGHFSYTNPEGKRVIVQYTAGFEGFQVLSNAQPEASAAVSIASPGAAVVEDLPDVIKARQEHLALFEEARTRIKHPKILQSIKTAVV